MSGRLIRKIEPHQKNSSRAPPMIGPITAPPVKATVHRPMAVRRWAGSANMARISENVDGARVAPPMPSRARPRMNSSGLEDRTRSAEAVPKAAAPASRSRLRPMRSPRLPIVMSSPARTKP